MTNTTKPAQATLSTNASVVRGISVKSGVRAGDADAIRRVKFDLAGGGG